MIMEVKAKSFPKIACNNYESSHFYSHVFQKPSSDLSSSFAQGLYYPAKASASDFKDAAAP